MLKLMLVNATFYPDLEARYGTPTLRLAMSLASEAGTSADRMHAVAETCQQIADSPQEFYCERCGAVEIWHGRDRFNVCGACRHWED